MPLYLAECAECGKREHYVAAIDERHATPVCHGQMQKILEPTSVRVFPTYMTAAFDKEQGRRIQIGSTSEHEAFLRRNGYNEVGDDASCRPMERDAVIEDHARQRAEAKRDAELTVQLPDNFLTD